jgi:hypothetical protein
MVRIVTMKSTIFSLTHQVQLAALLAFQPVFACWMEHRFSARRCWPGRFDLVDK